MIPFQTRADRRSFLTGLFVLALAPLPSVADDEITVKELDVPMNPWVGRDLTALERLKLGAFQKLLNDKLSGLPLYAELLDNHVRLRIPAAMLYKPGRDELTPEGVAILTLVAERMIKAKRNVRLEIVAHHDTRATDYEAAVFTKRRAVAVRAALESRGVEAYRLKATGAGRKFPYVEGKSLENQRIELIFRPL